MTSVRDQEILFSKKWEETEQALKSFERVSPSVVISAINEMRWAGRYAAEALAVSSSEAKEELYKKAITCLGNAQADAMDAAYYQMSLNLSKIEESASRDRNFSERISNLKEMLADYKKASVLIRERANDERIINRRNNVYSRLRNSYFEISSEIDILSEKLAHNEKKKLTFRLAYKNITVIISFGLLAVLGNFFAPEVIKFIQSLMGRP